MAMQQLDAASYQALSDRDHVLRRPGMYIGSTKATYAHLALWGQDNRFHNGMVWTIDGLLKLIDELLYNASDAVSNSLQCNIQPGPIFCQIDAQSITVRNGGIGIPVERKFEPAIGEEKWIPEIIFGFLRTGSNYDNAQKNTTKVGQNGLGAKLCNLLGRQFEITVADGLKNKLILQTAWMQNMSQQSPPQVTPYQGPSYVEVKMYPDWRYFSGPNNQPIQTWPDSIVGLVGKIAANISYHTSNPVIINQNQIHIQSIMDYAQAVFTPEHLQNHVHCMITMGEHKLDILFVDTPGDACTISMVNGKETRQHGTHVLAVKQRLAKELIRIINKRYNIKASKDSKDKDGKSKPKDSREINGRKLNVAYIDANISCLIFYKRPGEIEFGGQAKDSYGDELPDFKLPPKKMEAMGDWAALEAIRSFINGVDRRLLAKSDGKKTTNIRLGYGEEDANWAGSAKSAQCELSIVEGKSAKAYWTVANGFIKNARDRRGVLPMRGKLLNTYNANAESVANYKPIAMLKQMTGLREGMDYTIEANFKTLRYGKIIILVDADPDGTHIAMLILTYFRVHYPSLFMRQDFFQLERTPVIRTAKGNFYTLAGHEQARLQGSVSGRERYMKGLASSSKPDIKLDYNNRHLVQLLWDEYCNYFFHLTMCKHTAHQRKDWMFMPRQFPNLEQAETESISTYAHHEYFIYGQVCLPRAVATLDGFNNARGKMVAYTFRHWKGINSTEPTKETKTAKIAQFGNAICARMGYHHGEKAMIDAVIRSSQDYITAPNNEPMLTSKAMTGTRNDKDWGDARYLFVTPSWATPYLFPAADDRLRYRLRIKEEGEFIEPLTNLPVLPYALLNGVHGVGVGWSTDIYSYNPREIAE